MLQEVLTMSLCCELIQDNGTDNLHYPINFDILNSSIRWTAAFCRLTVTWMTLFSLSTTLYSQILLLHLHFSTFTQTPSGTNKCRTDHFIFWPSPGLFMHKTCGMCWPLLISLRAFEIIATSCFARYNRLNWVFLPCKTRASSIPRMCMYGKF